MNEGYTHRSTSERHPIFRFTLYVCVALCLVLSGYVLNSVLHTKQTPVTQQPVASTTPLKSATVTSTSTDEEDSGDLYRGIDDEPFVSFAIATIDKRCPFYEPNGVAYHQCLSDWVSSLEKVALVEQIDEVHAYCEMFSKKYADSISFESSELFSKCVIYKLQP